MGSGRSVGRCPFRLNRDQVDLTFSRSSGAGGQNVNKVNSKAEARWNIYYGEPRLPEPVRRRFLERFRGRLDASGFVISVSELTRDRERNITDAIAKIENMVASVWEPPKPRIPTRPTRGSQLRRLSEKRKSSEKKRLRAARGNQED